MAVGKGVSVGNGTAVGGGGIGVLVGGVVMVKVGVAVGGGVSVGNGVAVGVDVTVAVSVGVGVLVPVGVAVNVGSLLRREIVSVSSASLKTSARLETTPPSILCGVGVALVRRWRSSTEYGNSKTKSMVGVAVGNAATITGDSNVVGGIWFV